MKSPASPFPPHVKFVALTAAEVGDDRPHPEELSALAPGAVGKRRAEFALGRIAARRALIELGVEATPILIGGQREPLWPDGVVGSISHTAGRAVAAVCALDRSAGLGVDIENFRPVEEGVARHIGDDGERAWIAAVAGDERTRRLIQLLSAKESVFKAFFRHRRERFGFAAVTLSWDETTATFHGRLRQAMGPRYPVGHELRIGCAVTREYVLTSLFLPP